MNKKMNNKGFSLVELIIVIAIMAILVGVLAPQFIKYVQKSRISKDLQNAEELKTAVEVFAAGNEGLADDVEITAGANSLTVTGASEADLVGIKLPVSLSATWSGGGTFTFDKSSYTWGVTGDSTVTHDSKTYSMASVFNGTAASTTSP